MAIQLSERDMLIFKFIEEHHVLLEKHIAWFISGDDKPVLIRDRLRKLFYLDYLYCEKHSGKLPWWTTPTKPLVYTLSPLSRSLINSNEPELSLTEPEVQRHMLEIANIRMLCMIDQNAGLFQEFTWSTTMQDCKDEEISTASIAAAISFQRDGAIHKALIMNHPIVEAISILRTAEAALAEAGAHMLWIVSRDDIHQQALQRSLQGSRLAGRVAFATHQELYKAGICNAKWHSLEGKPASVVVATERRSA